MSYDDVDEIKKQLHDAYMKACVFIGDGQSFDVVEEDVFETSKIKVVIKMEVKK